jgi:hypothetical protein
MSVSISPSSQRWRDRAVALLQEHDHLAELIFSDDGQAMLHIVSRQHRDAAAQ